MKCDKCKVNNATYHSTVNINGNITQTHLCEECSKSNKLFSFNNFFTPFQNINNYFEEEENCENCGYTYSDFKENGLLGCSNCYRVFHNLILDNLQKIQPSLEHTGCKPFYIDENSESESNIQKLQVQLKQAVNEENYELASKIKQQIIKLKEGDSNE